MIVSLQEYQNKIKAIEDSIQSLELELKLTQKAMYQDFCQSMVDNPDLSYRVVLEFYEQDKLVDVMYWNPMSSDQVTYKLFEWIYHLQYQHFDKKIKLIEKPTGYKTFYIENYETIGYTEAGLSYRSCQAFILSVLSLSSEYQSK